MRLDDALEDNPKVSPRDIAECHGALYGWCLSRCGYDREAAEDLMQQTYVEILTGRARFDGRSTLKTFLFAIAKNLAGTGQRQRIAHARVLASIAVAGNVEDQVRDFTDDSGNARIWQAVRQLSTRQRDLVELVFCRDLTIEQAAEVMGVTIGTARVHYDRAKKALARLLSVEEPSIPPVGSERRAR